MWESLEQVGWVKVLATTGWLYSSVSVVHYFTLLVMVGSIVLLDLRVLGVAGRRRPLIQLAEELFPWMWTAFGLAIFSGFLEFTTDAGDYLPDKVFRVKMTVILLAVMSAIVVQRGVPKWGQLPAIPTGAKVIAFVSILLWIGSILAGVEIAALSGLG